MFTIYFNIKKRFYTILVVLISININCLYSNNQFDTIEKKLINSTWEDSVKIFIQLSEGYLSSNPQKSIELGKKALKISENYKENKLKAESYNSIGKGFEFSKQNDLALSFYRDALQLSNKERIDEVISKTYNNIGVIFYKSREYDSALFYINESLKIREKSGNQEEIANSLNNISGIYIVLGKYKEAEIALKRLLDINKILADKEEIANANDYLGFIYSKLGKLDKALQHYLNELKLREELNDNEEMYKFLTKIGKIYFKLGGEQNLNKALEYFKKSLSINQNKNNIIETAKSLSDLGNVYYEMKKYKKALDYYQKSLEYTESKKTNSKTDRFPYLQGKAVLLNNIGLVYKNMDNYQKALDFCSQSIEIKEEIGDDNNLFYPLTSLAEINLKLSNYRQSIHYLNKALKIAQSKNNIMLMQEAHYLMYEVYSSAGNFREALENHKKFVSLKDSLLRIQNNKMISEMQTKYETDIKDRENQRLKEANTLQRNYFIIISALILLILVVTFSRYISKQKANKLLSEKNQQINQQHKELEYIFSQLQIKEENLREANATKDKFFSIIAHDLKNPLHAITLSSDLLAKKYGRMNREQLKSLVTNINTAGSHLSNLLENLLQWSRTQNGKINFQPEDINLYNIIQNNFELLVAIADKKDIKLISKISGYTAVFADNNMLNTIILNLLSNAIKFSYSNSNVIVEAYESDTNFINISVKDYGVGISKEDISKLFRIDIHHTTIGTSKEKGTGLGLILCKEFVEINGGKIWVESEPDKGSTFTFSIPLSQKNEKQIINQSINVLNLN
jgi:signal transduction histidine kinase